MPEARIAATDDLTSGRLFSCLKAPDQAPAAPGIYAWWLRSGSIPGIEAGPKLDDVGNRLLYVGMASGTSARSTLRGRLRTHVRGAVGASTLRLTLAALLLDELKLAPTYTGRVVLSHGDRKRLEEWQRAHLGVRWHECSDPAALESRIVADLAPPLNREHAAKERAQYAVVGAARSALRARARGSLSA